MDDNSFMKHYRSESDKQQEKQNVKDETDNDVKQSGESGQSKSSQYKYDQKSGFVKTEPSDTDTPSPLQEKRKKILVVAVSGVVILLVIILVAVLLLNPGIKVIDLHDWTVNDAGLWATDKGINLQIEEQYNDQSDEGKIVDQDPQAGETVDKGGFVKIIVSLGHDQTVSLSLPDFMSMTKEAIDKWVSDNFMSKVRITTEYSDLIAAGKVIRFEINDSTVLDSVKRSTPIYITVSKGREDEAATITLPDFKKMTVADSYIFANENSIELVIEEEYDDYISKGTIMQQSIKAAEKVHKGETIVLTVSKGKEIVIPDFSGFSKEKATALAAQMGISLTITEKYSSQKTGGFIRQSLPSGSVYEDGDVLEISYSIGNKVVIPSFVGQTQDAIETWAKDLNDRGANIIIQVTSTNSNKPKGTILYQDKANTLIGVQNTIQITVSLGKAVFVPDFVMSAGSGYDVAITRDEALALCDALGIVPVIIGESTTGRLPGEVWYQSVAAGMEVQEGSTIILKFNPANVTVTVPDFTGMTEAQIRSGGYYMNFDITLVVSETVVDGYADKVCKQSLPAGTTVACGSAITLTVGRTP